LYCLLLQCFSPVLSPTGVANCTVALSLPGLQQRRPGFALRTHPGYAGHTSPFTRHPCPPSGIASVTFLRETQIHHTCVFSWRAAAVAAATPPIVAWCVVFRVCLYFSLEALCARQPGVSICQLAHLLTGLRSAGLVGLIPAMIRAAGCTSCNHNPTVAASGPQTCTSWCRGWHCCWDRHGMLPYRGDRSAVAACLEFGFATCAVQAAVWDARAVYVQGSSGCHLWLWHVVLAASTITRMPVTRPNDWWQCLRCSCQAA
jgi:hypothetical protein